MSMSSSEAAAETPAADEVYLTWFVTVVAGHRFQGVVATPGDPVWLVREPDNEADPNAIAVHDAAGRRIGYLFREVAADYAGLIDRGLVRLSGRLVGVDEPGYDAARAAINPPLVVDVHADPDRLEEFLRGRARSMRPATG